MVDMQAGVGAGWGIGNRASDQELLERFVPTRDEAAFALLVERHGGGTSGDACATKYKKGRGRRLKQRPTNFRFVGLP